MKANHPVLNEQEITAFVQEAREVLKDFLKDSGTILYSSFETLKRGKYYFLGLNPGGSELDTENSIGKSLENLRSQTQNAYLKGPKDGIADWGRYPSGDAPLQLRYQYLFTELGLGEKLDSVCASNLIFRRSVGEKGSGGIEMADLCWKVHEAILKIVQPEAIIVFGKLPYFFIKDKLNGTDLTESCTKHGSWKLRHSILKGGAILNTEAQLIGLPHLSRYAIDSDKAVIDKIKTYLGLV
ncbi:MAG: hypothetical protein ABSD43_03555 [Terracidiphilus sp.]